MRYARLFARLAAVLLALASGLAMAQSPALSLYAGEVPVPDQSDEQRVEALRNALAQVVVKLTGDKSVLANESVAKAVADAERYVQRYQYQQEVVTEGDQPVARLSLIATFDRAAVDRLVRERGLRVWAPAARAPLLAWVAIDDGAGPRLLAGGDAGAQSMQHSAQMRGLGLAWPARGDADWEALALQSVWSGDLAALSADAARYQTDSLFVAQLRRIGDSWSGRWTLVQGGQVVGTWDTKDGDMAGLLAAAVDEAANRIGTRSAQVPEERRITSARVWISGIASASDYARVFDVLGHNNLVRDFTPEQARGDGVLMKLTLNLALDRWLAYLPPEGDLRLVNAAPPLEGVEATLALTH
ncbi:DUF2066 domain-containing protein [Tahibacter amnicola]|uniref:DUF2066 domain-containing protein n=1 Tax=Tahibacter amnicola TaxID=2976241 RepID=A0ABY6BI33_9GAMM|nr:DUF2066 domain-containing protein [Tahibacter amnicola]UXI69437.1 DUF2066 domain-containing protein [Tahibacter amnicola]